jgi:hypothetical protein
VKIDLLYEIQIPLPHGPTTERDYFWQALAQVEAADCAGFGCAWAVEHHFLTEFAHSSAPEVFLTACAMRTERIRVGHGAHRREPRAVAGGARDDPTHVGAQEVLPQRQVLERARARRDPEALPSLPNRVRRWIARTWSWHRGSRAAK